MNISSMSNVNWEKSPNIKATCTIRTSEGFLIKECKVINGMHGIFVASPSKPSSKPWTKKDGTVVNYDDVVIFPKEIRDELTSLATNCYDASKPLYKAYDENGNMVTYNTGDTTTEAPAITVTAGDELIPF